MLYGAVLSFQIRATQVECTALFLSSLAFALAYRDAEKILLCMGSILLHEMGHLLAMGVQGVGVHRVTFGFMRVTVVPSHAADLLQEVFILLCGPLANLFLSAVLFRLGCTQAAYINVAFVAVNLVPAGVLDGGRLFHLLALRVLGSRRADDLSFFLSVLFGGAMVCAGVYSLFVTRTGPALLLFGAFVLIGGFQNLRYTNAL